MKIVKQFALLAFLAALVLPIKGGVASEVKKGEMRVTLLGSGTPIPSPHQYGSAVLVQAGGKALLFDCGRGCTSRLAQVDTKLITQLENLFVTHLHSDHIVGIADLWLNGWVQGRDVPLKTYGPTGTKHFLAKTKEAFREDIDIRIKKGVPATTDGIRIDVRELRKGRVVFHEGGVKVTAFLVDHPPIEPAFGFRVDYAGRALVISGDTNPTQNMIKYADGVDVIIHEVISPTLVHYVREHFTEKQANAVIGIHTTVEQAAEIFQKTKPKLAVYYHTPINTPEEAAHLVAATNKTFDGKVMVGSDLLQITIGDDVKTFVPEK